GSLEATVRQEAESRIPFPAAETELRFLEVADVRQGDALRREVIVLACHRPRLDELLAGIEDAGFRPIAVEVEAIALLRCYSAQFRRDEDRDQRILFAHIGYSSTAVLIGKGSDVLFFKYLDIGGKHFDEAIARQLQMTTAEAWALRRHNGDRRADQQDPEIARSIADATRPVVDKLSNELSMCVRYHSVTFRGHALSRMVLAGGEATSALVDKLAAQLDLKAELGDPLRTFPDLNLPGRRTQWDIALGLALRPSASVGRVVAS
ncbi:MAG TPA: pilus assembly protein PilM, partial [Pirellulales bacterium]|nr:pilus assembly protein PilM [Pirellulales bacterium]